MNEIDDTSVETVTEEVVEEQSDISQVEIDLDELINAEFDDPAMNGEHAGLPHYQDILKHLPENARKLISNLRSSYTKKTQQLAAEKRRLEEIEDTINAERELLLNQEWGFDDAENNETGSSTSNSNETDVEKRIQEAVAKALQSRFQPLKEKHEAQQRQLELHRFKTENPDLEQLRPDITELLLDRPELGLKDAYLIVKGKKLQEQMRASRVQQRSVQQKIGGGSVGNAPKGKPPAEMRDPYQIFLFHKAQAEGK